MQKTTENRDCQMGFVNGDDLRFNKEEYGSRKVGSFF